MTDTSSEAARPGKRLALFFDGTWNEPADHTNVRRLHLMLAERDPAGVPQRAFYDPGVGTRWFDRLSGGAFGFGLSANIRDGYRWLVENYDPGDEIYIFGFSRGAFTARSLAGLIARCGLLMPNSPISFTQLFDRYRRGAEARPIYGLIRDKKNIAAMTFEEQAILRTAYYRHNLIRFLGVWDTVGSIGVPLGKLPGISRNTLKFHNTRLSRAIEHSYHAMAIDEYRAPYWVVLWTEFFPDIPDDPETPRADSRYVEQRWFSGAHANVGGGYRSDPLPDRPLRWLQGTAQARGLYFRSEAERSDGDLVALPRDSYSEFLAGTWKLLTGGRRFVRPIMADPVRKTAGGDAANPPVPGWVQTVNERIDSSVFLRCQRCPKYRPPGLREWAARKSLDLEEVIRDPARYPALSAPVDRPGVERVQVVPTAS